MFRGYLMFEYLKEWIRTKEKEENEIVDRFLLDFELENLDNYLKELYILFLRMSN